MHSGVLRYRAMRKTIAEVIIITVVGLFSLGVYTLLIWAVSVAWS